MGALVPLQVDPSNSARFLNIQAFVDSLFDPDVCTLTPVQTAVKREDEQAFAKLNADNLMFCEDAARRVHAALDADERVVDFHAKVSHFESLHAHDAVAVVTKGHLFEAEA